MKLKELESKHEFSARVQLFKHYKDRERQLSQESEKILRSLGEAVGYAKGIGDEDTIAFTAEVLQECYTKAPAHVETANRELEQAGLSDTQEYQKLKDFLSQGEFEMNGPAEELWGNLMKITEIYSLLQHCNYLVSENRFNNLFGKYVSTQSIP